MADGVGRSSPASPDASNGVGVRARVVSSGVGVSARVATESERSLVSASASAGGAAASARGDRFAHRSWTATKKSRRSCESCCLAARASGSASSRDRLCDGPRRCWSSVPSDAMATGRCTSSVSNDVRSRDRPPDRRPEPSADMEPARPRPLAALKADDAAYASDACCRCDAKRRSWSASSARTRRASSSSSGVCLQGVNTRLPMLASPANFFVMRMGSQWSFSLRYDRSVVPGGHASMPRSNSRMIAVVNNSSSTVHLPLRSGAFSRCAATRAAAVDGAPRPDASVTRRAPGAPPRSRPRRRSTRRRPPRPRAPGPRRSSRRRSKPRPPPRRVRAPRTRGRRSRTACTAPRGRSQRLRRKASRSPARTRGISATSTTARRLNRRSRRLCTKT
mmetsp:Transcript_10804/g.33333  ORF Transcript_10804/g.33333 Transcript_10804/m.33333 type:complete len:393 (+) Transcript_10804:178-1356(+)